MSGTTCNCSNSICQSEVLSEQRMWKTIFPIFLAAIIWVGALCRPDGLFQYALFVVAYLTCGMKVLQRAVKNLIHGQFLDENFLMALASLSAFAIGEYAEGVGVMWFYQVGEFAMDWAVHRSRRSVRTLMELTPPVVHVKQNEQWRAIAPQEVQTGEILLIKPGERVALDGIVLQGNTHVDLSALTGESVPLSVMQGDEILAGGIVLDGAIEMRVTHPFTDSAVSKILQLVEHAYTKKTPSEKFITRFSRYYTPAVVAMALLVAFVPPLLFADATLKVWLYRALVFLVISCPCALVLSVPLGFFGGIGAAAKHGILIKGSGSLEALARGQMIAFDKTGTLTQGNFAVNSVVAQSGFTKEELLKFAAYTESGSNHPLARAVCAAYHHPIDETCVQERREEPGQGARAKVCGQTVLVGKAQFMPVPIDDMPAQTAVFISVDGIYAGYITLADQPKTDSRHAVEQLKSLGFTKTIMLTGDHAAAAAQAAKQIGVDEYMPSLLPGDKVRQLEILLAQKAAGRTVIFVGDGINDAPVLACADVGIAMGALGSDAAVEAADIVLANDQLSKIPFAVRLGRFTIQIVKQNICLALAVKTVVLVLGAWGLATLWQAVFADVGVAVICVFNSLRPLVYKE